MVSPIWDVAVAGAGPAGAVAALVLARAGRRVLLLDDARRPVRKVGESLPGGARPLLRDLGLLPVVEGGRHLPCYGNLSAWGSSELVATDFIRDPHGLGWHLERPRFDDELRAAAEAAGAVWQPGRVRAIAWNGAGWQIKFRDGSLAAGWLIDATGRAAAVARRAGALCLHDTPLVALYAWAKPQKEDMDTRTLVESMPDGWWYTARLPDAARIVVLHVDMMDASAILRTPGAWEARLAGTVHVGRLLAGATFFGAPRGAPAGGARLDRFGGPGWLAAGDAALSFDPLSSQGLLNALYTGMLAGQTAHAALSGQLAAPEAYANRLEAIRAAYLRHYRLVYQAERRWPDHAFWARRLEIRQGFRKANM